MSGMRNWRLGAAVVVGAVFLGAGGAVAAGKLISPGERSQAVVSDAAKQLGVEPAKLTAALKKALENQIDADVAAGRITKEHGEAMKKRIEAGDYPLLDVGPRFGGFGHGELDRHVAFGGLDAAAAYLGVTEEQLRTEIAGGKSLAEIAKAKGKSVDGLVDALTADAKKRLEDAVAAGRITKADADKALAEMKQRVTQRVNGVRGPDGLRGFRHGGPDFSGPPPVDPPPIGPPA